MRTKPLPIASPPSQRRWITGSLLAGLLLAPACSGSEISAPPPPPSAAAASAGGALVNGDNATGSITAAGQTDSWTFTANPGDYIVVSIGELSGTSDFTPWIRLVAPNGAVVGNSWNVAAAQIGVSATQSGTYTVLAATADAGNDATGNYRLTLVKTPGTIVVPSGDEGGTMTNGITYSGSVPISDLDAWKFTASAGNYIAVSMGEVSGTADFTPWIRLIAPNGAVVGNAWNVAAAQIGLNATQTGTYTVVVSTADAGNDATGTYNLTLAKGPGAAQKSAGDQGGTLPNGGNRAGTLYVGDLDQWKFTAATGDYIAVSVGETSGTADFTPWIRLVAPNGAVVGNSWNVAAAQVGLNASQTGTYTVIVSTADAGNDATGKYNLRLLKAPGAFTVPGGDHGGPMTNGRTHTGRITVGDLDGWSIAANPGDYIAVSVGETSGTADFTPWIRLVAPNGAVVGNSWNVAAAQIGLNASQAGTYTVIVSTADAGNDATGNYRITLAKGPGAFVVDSGDQGGTLTNGVARTGSLTVGELDMWSFGATQGGAISLTITEQSGTADFTPWIRLVAPNGTVVGNSWNASSAQINLNATQTGTYTVIASTADSGNDATGTYQISVTGAGVASQPMSAASADALGARLSARPPSGPR
jgi:hypothetical protein